MAPCTPTSAHTHTWTIPLPNYKTKSFLCPLRFTACGMLIVEMNYPLDSMPYGLEELTNLLIFCHCLVHLFILLLMCVHKGRAVCDCSVCGLIWSPVKYFLEPNSEQSFASHMPTQSLLLALLLSLLVGFPTCSLVWLEQLCSSKFWGWGNACGLRQV